MAGNDDSQSRYALLPITFVITKDMTGIGHGFSVVFARLVSP